MGVWKKLNSQDAFISAYVAKKQWDASREDLANLGIRFLPAHPEYSEPDCEFKVVDCSFDIEGSILDCTFEVSGSKLIPLDCTFELYNCVFEIRANLLELPPVLPPTPSPSPTTNPSPTPTPSPAEPLDCTFELEEPIVEPPGTPTAPTPSPTAPTPSPAAPSPAPSPSPAPTGGIVNTIFLHIPS